MKDGRKPIRQKEEDTFSFNPANLLEVSDSVRDAISKDNMELRFISYKDFVNNGGHHKNHWKPYKIDYAKMGLSTEFLPGQDASGFIRRGDLVLAVRPKEIGRQHKAMLTQKLKKQRHVASRGNVEALKETARELGSRVVTGYDGED